MPLTVPTATLAVHECPPALCVRSALHLRFLTVSSVFRASLRTRESPLALADLVVPFPIRRLPFSMTPRPSARAQAVMLVLTMSAVCLAAVRAGGHPSQPHTPGSGLLAKTGGDALSEEREAEAVARSLSLSYTFSKSHCPRLGDAGAPLRPARWGPLRLVNLGCGALVFWRAASPRPLPVPFISM